MAAVFSAPAFVSALLHFPHNHNLLVFFSPREPTPSSRILCKHSTGLGEADPRNIRDPDGLRRRAWGGKKKKGGGGQGRWNVGMSERMECQTGQVTPHIRRSCQRGCDRRCYYSLQRDEAAESADELWTPPPHPRFV